MMATHEQIQAWAKGCVLERQILSMDVVLDIPPEVAVCPKCGGKLSVQFEGWSQRDDGTWEADEAKPDCEHEPDIESAEWEEWFNWHYDMPYVDWLPLETMLTEWVNRRYSFDLD